MTNTFLKKLYKSNKIDLVQPNENIKDAYLNKSDDYLDTAKLCVDNDKLEQSVSMSYYSMYYSVLALLFNTGIKSEVHTASILILNKVYGLDDSKISFAKTERVDKQYFIDFSIAKEESEELIEMVLRNKGIQIVSNQLPKSKRWRKRKR